MSAINGKRYAKSDGRAARRYPMEDNVVEQYGVLAEATGMVGIGGCLACYLHLVLGVSSASHRCEQSAA